MAFMCIAMMLFTMMSIMQENGFTSSIGIMHAVRMLNNAELQGYPCRGPDLTPNWPDLRVQHSI